MPTPNHKEPWEVVQGLAQIHLHLRKKTWVWSFPGRGYCGLTGQLNPNPYLVTCRNCLDELESDTRCRGLWAMYYGVG
jgi:hypothetical protein